MQRLITVVTNTAQLIQFEVMQKRLITVNVNEGYHFFVIYID